MVEDAPRAGDTIREAGFPSVEQLRRGIVLRCIAEAFAIVAREPYRDDGWDDGTYYRDDLQSEHWAVSFEKSGAVAVFYASDSPRNPFPKGRPPYDQSWYFRRMPGHLAPLRDRALSQMHDLDFRVGEPARAVITAAMWADGPRFTSHEPWAEVYVHSSWVMRPYLLPPDESLRECWQGLGLPKSLMSVVWSIYSRRVASDAPAITVQADEWRVLVEFAGDDPNKVWRAEGPFADVGITLEAP